MTGNQRPLIGAYLVLIQDEKVLLSKSKSEILAGKYSMIAGHTEKGETVINAIIREAKEEAGIDITPEDLQVVLTMQRPNAPYKGDPTDIIDIFIKATKFSGQIQNNEPEKCEEIVFFDINNLPEQTLPHVKKAIDLIAKNQHFCIYE